MSAGEHLAGRLALIVITGQQSGASRATVDLVRAALRGGAPAIQLRDKNASARELVEVSLLLLAETRGAGALLFVNDRLDVALAAGADGVHLGDDDLPVAVARRIAPPGFLIGASADSPETGRAAERAGADYLGVGPAFATATKLDAGDAIGPAGVARVAAAAGIPVVGIGGIDADNAAEVIGAGAAGVAVVSAVMGAADPEAATSALLTSIRRVAA